jgi:hypothetical protein
MQHWPNPKDKLIRSLRLEATKRILEIALKTKGSKVELFKNLQSVAEMNLQPKDFELVICPDKLTIEPSIFGFSDIIFPEHFFRLQKELKQLISEYCSPFSSPSVQKDEIDRWFESVYASQANDLYSLPIGTLVFNKPKHNFLKLLKRADFHLTYISPSFIILSAVFEPSEIFNQKFVHLTQKSSQCQNEILGFSIKKGFTALSSSTLRHKKA